MNRTLAITTIALVAVVMGMSVVSPVMAHDVTERNGLAGNGTCPDGFVQSTIGIGVHPDHNRNGFVCTNRSAVVDDLPCVALNGECPPRGGGGV